MYKIIIVIFLFCYTYAFSQINPDNFYCNNNSLISLNNNNNNIAFEKSFSVYLSPLLFIPVNLDLENRTGFGTQIGIQWNYKEKNSICLDFDMAYTVTPGYDYGIGIYRMSVSSKWNNYLMLTAGAKFYFPLNEKIKLFCTPGLGVLSARKRANQPELAPIISVEFGGQYKLSNNFSAFCKLKASPQIKIVVMGGNSDLGGVVLFNSGIIYQF